MKKNFTRYLYVFCAIIIIAFFAFFGVFLYKRNNRIYSNIVDFSVKSETVTVECGGVASGTFVFTVAHLFSSVDMNDCAYVNDGICAFIHMPKGFICSNFGKELSCMFIYADFNADVAVVFLKECVYPDIIRNRNISSASFFAPRFLGEKYSRVNGKGFSFIDGRRYLTLDFTAEKGLSGYPVFDSSGYVNGIICSYDKNNGSTYAVPKETLISVVSAAEKLYMQICS